MLDQCDPDRVMCPLCWTEQKVEWGTTTATVSQRMRRHCSGCAGTGYVPIWLGVALVIHHSRSWWKDCSRERGETCFDADTATPQCDLLAAGCWVVWPCVCAPGQPPAGKVHLARNHELRVCWATRGDSAFA